MQISEISGALATLAPAKGRGEIKPGPNGSTLIDDSYNANRQSIVAMTHALRASQLSPGGKRWAVLGDIFELGQYAREEHFQSGAYLAGRIDYLVALGDYARYYVEGAIHAGLPVERTWYFPANVENQDELQEAKHAAADLLKARVHSEDLVLVKGSRGMHMETMLSLL
jgi:UDP-N-acetylmuramoyl-tripeptide--D-alanyl-D-alanine ligase